MTVVVLAHAAAAAYLAGLAWVVQLVVYPGFALVPTPVWAEFHAAHSQRITAALALPWAVQGATTIALVVDRPATVSTPLLVVDALLAALPVAVTLPAARLHASSDRLREPGLLRALLWVNLCRALLWVAGTATAMRIVLDVR